MRAARKQQTILWPSFEEISKRAAQVRAGWSPREFRKRAGLSPLDAQIDLARVSFGSLEGRKQHCRFE